MFHKKKNLFLNNLWQKLRPIICFIKRPPYCTVSKTKQCTTQILDPQKKLKAVFTVFTDRNYCYRRVFVLRFILSPCIPSESSHWIRKNRKQESPYKWYYGVSDERLAEKEVFEQYYVLFYCFVFTFCYGLWVSVVKMWMWLYQNGFK